MKRSQKLASSAGAQGPMISAKQA